LRYRSTYDGFFTIDLTSQDAEVLGGQDPTFTVTYYTRKPMLQELIRLHQQTITSANTQTVYIRVTNNVTGCCETTMVDVITEQLEPHYYNNWRCKCALCELYDDSIERPLQLVAEKCTVEIIPTNGLKAERQLLEQPPNLRCSF
jgi:hypothetical protein